MIKMKIECIEGFSVDKCDDNGSTIENQYINIKEGSLWLMEETDYRFKTACCRERQCTMA
jgi:hypothetical protein